MRFTAAVLHHPGWHSIFMIKLAQALYGVGLRPLAWVVYRINFILFSVDIYPTVKLGAGAWLPDPIGIIIARDAVVGRNATIFQNVTIGGRGSPRPWETGSSSVQDAASLAGPDSAMEAGSERTPS